MPPKALLMYCPLALATELLDLGWEIAIGAQNPQEDPTYKLYVSDPPDPRHWNVIIDDSHHKNQPFTHIGGKQLPVHPITSEYLSECGKAHGIRICAPGQHTWAAYTREPRGHKSLEFSETDDERWQHVVDFVEDFQHDFTRARLQTSGTEHWRFPKWPTGFTPVFLDAYADAVLGILNKDEVDWLVSIDIPDTERRSQALLYLCTRTAPKLWPDIHAGDFMPKRVEALRAALDALMAKHHTGRRRIETDIEEEQTFYSRFAVVVQLGEEALKSKVQEVFEDVFGWETTDLDSQLTEGEPKRLDLLVQLPSGPALVEVRGSGTRNARLPDLEKFIRNLEKYPKELQDQTAKVLVFNGRFTRPLQVRAQQDEFSGDIVDEAKTQGIALVSARQLLNAVEAHRNGELTAEQFAEVLNTPGACNFPPQ